MDERVGFLHWQLDSIGCDTPLMGGLLLLGGGPRDRIPGGVLHKICAAQDLPPLKVLMP